MMALWPRCRAAQHFVFITPFEQTPVEARCTKPRWHRSLHQAEAPNGRLAAWL